jgi:HEAT repeat protein
MPLFSRRPRKNGKLDLEALAREGDVEGLQAALEHRDIVVDQHGTRFDIGARVRLEALEVLATSPDPRAQEAIVTALADDNVDVRLAAIRATRDYSNEHALNGLAWGVAAAPQQVGPLSSEQHARLIEKIEASRAEALRALVEAADPRALERVVSYLVHRSGDAPLTRADFEALRALLAAPTGRVAAAALGSTIAPWLAHERAPVAARTAQVLAALGQAARESLTAALADPALRRPAIEALGEVRDNGAIPHLVAHMSDPDPLTRGAVVVALGRIRDPAASGALVAASSDPDYEVRSAAIEALDGLGTAAVIASVADRIDLLHERRAEAVSRTAEPPAIEASAALQPERAAMPEAPPAGPSFQRRLESVRQALLGRN